MPKPPPDLGYLCQRWVHSYEEDSETESVYRPEGFDLPPARGRRGFELLPDNSFRSVGIAAGDGSRVAEGRWELKGEETERRIRIQFEGTDEVLTIASLESDRLAIRKE